MMCSRCKEKKREVLVQEKCQNSPIVNNSSDVVFVGVVDEVAADVAAQLSTLTLLLEYTALSIATGANSNTRPSEPHSTVL